MNISKEDWYSMMVVDIERNLSFDEWKEKHWKLLFSIFHTESKQDPSVASVYQNFKAWAYQLYNEQHYFIYNTEEPSWV